YLCELKDAQIRGGLHILGRPPEGDAEIDLLAALLRLPQGPVPSLRTAVAESLGLDLDGGRAAVDAVDAECKRLLREARAAGRALAEALCARHLAGTGAYPSTVGLVVWGTAAIRTQGDDVAEALALLGVRPCWAEESGRVTGLEVIPLSELGRPRVDVTLRISGFFRDAFPNLVHLVDEAVELVLGLDERAEDNQAKAHG